MQKEGTRAPLCYSIQENQCQYLGSEILQEIRIKSV